MDNYFKLILIIIILCVLSLILIFMFGAFLRRISRNKKFKELDKQREFYKNKLEKALHSGSLFQEIADFTSTPQSIKWLAIEEILLELINDNKFKSDAKELFNRLGYVAYYENRLKSSNSMTKSSSIDKLGNMLSEQSTDKLIKMLKSENTEVISVTVRALSKTGSIEGLRNILAQLPILYSKGLVSRKMIEASLIKFDVNTVPVFLEYGRTYEDPKTIASLLEVLSYFKAKEILSFAVDNLKNVDAEIRAKALKTIGIIAVGLVDFDGEQLVSLLNDPVWFVRLQGAKALGNLKYKRAVDILGGLLLDENWQVRNAAAIALTKMGDISIDIFLNTLRTTDDRYAKERICEEIEKTDLVYVLIENLADSDKEIFRQSKEILGIMRSLNFSTPLIVCSKTGTNNKIKNELALILKKEPGI